jgi:hypothetical protein
MPCMERRSEPRVAANEPMIVTELGHRRLHSYGGLIAEISGNSLTITLPSAIACGTSVKVEAWDVLMLGEVVRCEPAGAGFRLALRLHHSLRGLQALQKLNQALLGERAVPEDSVPVHIMRE